VGITYNILAGPPIWAKYYTMRFFEINDPKIQTAPAATPDNAPAPEAPVAATKAVPPTDVAVPVEAEPNYADLSVYQGQEGLIKQELIDQGATDVKIEPRKAEKGRVPHIRLDNVGYEQLSAAMTALGFTEASTTARQDASSGKFDTYAFQADDTTYTVVLRGFKNKGSAPGAGSSLVLNQKELTPTNLNLTGQEFTSRQELADQVKSALASKFKDQQLVAALSELVDNATAGGSAPMTAENLQYIKPKIKQISQDFGEILAPLVLANDGDPIVFPAGNEKLIDVTIGANKYSVKAMSGSGTSMNSLGELLDEYELSLTDQGKKTMFQNAIKIWKSTRKEGSVLDRLCLASYKNKTPEYIAFKTILGNDFASYKADSQQQDDKGNTITVSSLLSLIQAATGGMSYSDFLKTVYPAMTAGNWAKPTGLPDDGMYYMGMTEKKPVAGVAGKFSYDANPVDGAGNIICYSLGQALQNMIKKGPNASQYKEIMTDMVKTLKCMLGHVKIGQDGSLIVSSTSFADLEFEFDYHAPSHIAGNNRPGFMIIQPGAKKAKKVAQPAV
jgi:hypothetical protein